MNKFFSLSPRLVLLIFFFGVSFILFLLIIETVSAQNVFESSDEKKSESESASENVVTKISVQTSPLFKHIPFDRITLKETSARRVFDVLSIEFPEGKRPPFQSGKLPQNGEIVVRFCDNPSKQFTIAWNLIEKWESFSELVWQEFQEKLAVLSEKVLKWNDDETKTDSLDDDFDLLYDYLIFLEQHRSQLADFESYYAKYLFDEGVYRTKTNDFLTGFSRFEALFLLQQKSDKVFFPELQKEWVDAVNPALQHFFDSDQMPFCRNLLKSFQFYYPNHEIVQKWNLQLENHAQQLLQQAKLAFAKNDFVASHFLIDEATKAAPHLPEIKIWQERLQKEAPRIRVSVSEKCPILPELFFETEMSSTSNLPQLFKLQNRSTLRSLRLLTNALVEYQKPGPSGGIYQSFLGKMEKSPRQIRWTFLSQNQAEPATNNSNWSTTEIARFLSLNSNFFANNRFVTEIENKNAHELILLFSRPVLLPEAHLTFPLDSFGMSNGTEKKSSQDYSIPTEMANKAETQFSIQKDGMSEFAIKSAKKRPIKQGRFTWEQHDNSQNAFQMSPFYWNQVSETAPKVIVEQVISESTKMLPALENGEIDLIERLPPWLLSTVKQSPHLVLRPYSIPSQHFLVPNLQKPLTGNRTFRRGILYGINRTKMLEHLKGEGVIVSVPFVKGISLDDPSGYAYNTAIAPRPHEPKLAIALTQLAFDEIRNKNAQWKDVLALPELVLAHPNNEMSEWIAQMIRRQMAVIGISMRIVPFRDDEPIGADADIDFWLVDSVVKEPLVDAERLFGRNGLLGSASPYMELALEKVRLCENWGEASAALQDVHRLCFEETTVLPLWQMTDYYVHRADIEGIAPESAPIDIYQNILESGGWQLMNIPKIK
ncbi:MAG: ABC transporter substrate-binding protein [Thermoguttaceae bacterium]